MSLWISVLLSVPLFLILLTLFKKNFFLLARSMEVLKTHESIWDVSESRSEKERKDRMLGEHQSLDTQVSWAVQQEVVPRELQGQGPEPKQWSLCWKALGRQVSAFLLASMCCDTAILYPSSTPPDPVLRGQWHCPEVTISFREARRERGIPGVTALEVNSCAYCLYHGWLSKEAAQPHAWVELLDPSAQKAAVGQGQWPQLHLAALSICSRQPWWNVWEEKALRACRQGSWETEPGSCLKQSDSMAQWHTVTTAPPDAQVRPSRAFSEMYFSLLLLNQGLVSVLWNCLLSPRIKNHLQKATRETIFKLTLINFFVCVLPKYCTCRSHVKDFSPQGNWQECCKKQPVVLPSHPPATWEPQQVWEDAAYRKCKRLIASYLNSVLVSPYPLSLCRMHLEILKKGVLASCEFTFSRSGWINQASFS